jgi:ParB/RepB/Spo0J family partition protein
VRVTTGPEERVTEIGNLRESLVQLRVLDAGALRGMRESLVRHGQMMAVAAYPVRCELEPSTFELVDGFKRLRAARELGWAQLRVRILTVDAVAAKVAMSVLNDGRGLSELEEAWLVRSLYREDGLTQPEIGRLLGRHKSWVSRRLMLAESLDEVVQADVRLGLLAARTAEALARLPRVNQRAAAEGVIKRGLTHHQTQRLVAEVLATPEGERTPALLQALDRVPEAAGPASGRSQAERTPAQWLVADAAALTRIGARLQARLWARPLAALGEPAARLVTETLAGLQPVLASLHRTLERATKGDLRAAVDNSGGA